MSSVSYFKNAKNFVANPTFNTYVSNRDALQYLHKHSATGAMHDSEERHPPPLCHPGTGEAVVGRIEAWYRFGVPPEKKIMWVFAPAGYGKTSIAGTVSKNLESRTDLDFNPIGATFFFSRTSPERNSPARFIITLAYQFAMSIPELAPHIDNAVKRNPMILNKALEAQLMKLIVEPFKSLGELDSMPHRLVIIDGLDECINSVQESRVEKHYAEDQERVQVRVLDLLYTLQSHRLPLYFLVLSRPEPWIKQRVEARPFQTVTEMVDLYEVGDHLDDVEKFVRDELARIAESLDSKPGDGEQWPKEELVQRFLQTTGGHMVYAATVVRHIDVPYDDPAQRLQGLLDGPLHSNPDLAHSSPFSSLFELYRQVIRSCPPANRFIMREVLEDIVAVHESGLTFPVYPTLDILDRISGRAPGRGTKVLRPLHAVMRLVTVTDEDPPATLFYHSSFLDFVMNRPQLALDVAVGAEKGIGRLLAGSLNIMSTVTLNGPIDKVSLFALSGWTELWGAWSPPSEADYSRQLEALLAIDLTACFVNDLTSRAFSFTLLHCTRNLYHPTDNFLVRELSPSISSPFIEDAVSHLRLSLEGALHHLLRPDVSKSHCTAPPFSNGKDPVSWLMWSLATYATETSERHPTGFASIVQALRKLRLVREMLFEFLEQKVLDGEASGREFWTDLINMLKLARQNGELQDTEGQ